MITMMILGEMKDAAAIFLKSKDVAAHLTDETWDIQRYYDAASFEAALSEGRPPDLTCVDITMMSGLDAAKRFRSSFQNAYMVIIADMKTSPMVYMRPNVGAQSLMLKPLTQDQLDGVIKEAVQALLDRMDQGSENAFIFQTRSGRRMVDYSQILYFESREKKLFLVTRAEEMAFYDTLDKLEETLPSFFARCHRSFLVNTRLIEQVAFAESMIYLKDGFEIPLARSCKKAFKELVP